MLNRVCSVFVRLTVLSVLVITVGATGCSSGGSVKTDSATTSTTGGTTSSTSGMTTATGGGTTLTSSTGGTAIATGGVTSQGGNTGQDGAVTDGEILLSADATCEASFWHAFTESMAVLGICYPTSSLPDGGVYNPPSWGEIVFDSAGQVIDITLTGLSASLPDDQAAVDQLANERWLCLAGQTIQYYCEVGD